MNCDETRKGFALGETLSGLLDLLVVILGLSLRSNPRLRLANAFGVKQDVVLGGGQYRSR